MWDHVPEGVFFGEDAVEERSFTGSEEAGEDGDGKARHSLILTRKIHRLEC
jgi:hypothetical protein